MTDHRPTIMLVHAHPDDEVISTGGIALKYHEQGARVVLVTCTRGEEGEIVDAELNTPENKARLAEIRDVELARAIALLNITDFHQLAYRDSGMINTPPNEHPESFNKADLQAATGRLVALVRQYQPDVLISYDENGSYGHPDHIMAHKITVAAFHAAGDPNQFPEAGPAWEPKKLYYTAYRRSIWRKAWEYMQARGEKTPLDDPEADLSRYVDDPRTTTAIEIGQYLPIKLQSLLEHRTQIGPTWGFLSLPEELRGELLSHEHFSLIESRVSLPEREDFETDLLLGIR